MKNEPALILSTVLAVVVAGIALLVAFGVELTGDQQTAIVGFVGAVGALVVGIITRSLVTPVGKLGTSNEMRHPNTDKDNDDDLNPPPLHGGGNFGQA